MTAQVAAEYLIKSDGQKIKITLDGFYGNIHLCAYMLTVK